MSTTHVDTLTGNPLALMNFGNSPLRVEGSHLHAPGGIALLAGSAGLSVNGAHITTNQGLTLTSRANGLVEIRTQGHLLSFEVKADQLAQATSPYQLPELLTNGGKLELRDSHLTGAHISMQGGSIHLANTHIRGDTVKVGDRTTNTLTLDNQATIRSSAGVVELIAKNTTFAGTIENPGGFVEVSGTEVLHFTGVVQAANLLIDPSHLWIIESIYQVPSGVSILTPSALVTLLQGGNITISATNEIKIPYVGSPLDFTGVPSGRSLTLQNATTITVERGFVNTNNLNFTIQATSTANVSLVPTES
ncbi:MAG: hypothetical protein NZ482_10005, partial [Gloeomargarita sp. SKYG98]|nr:hypothetical protein [Gloeomargarita sp. SKYG98]